MTEDDRMERAQRIRRMREGQRLEDEDPDLDEEATEPTPDDAGGASGPTPADAGEADEPAPADAGETGAPAEAADGGLTQAPVEPDGAEAASAGESADVTDVVGGDGATTAPVPSPEEMEAALAQEGIDPATGPDETASAEETTPEAEAAAEETGTTEEETRVLEFTLGAEQYCLDIQYIEEIVKQEQITRVPNTPDFVEGVVDLRGQITTIVNPKVAIDAEETGSGELIVVFDAESFDEQGYMGWVVDDVRQVSPVTESQVNDPPMQEDYINGVIDRDEDEQFVIWTTPDLALEEAA